MVKSSTAAKAVLTVLVVAGFTVAYALAEILTELRFLRGYGLVFLLGVVFSVVLFIWRVLPRWLIALAWTALAAYLTVLALSQGPSELFVYQVYLVIVLFALFLILLAKWIHDVRRVKRVVRRLDERTLAELKRVEGSFAGTRGEAQTQSSRGATTQALLRLDPATVEALGDVAHLGRQIQSERDTGFPMNLDRILESIGELERTMAVRGVTRSRRSTMLTSVELLGGGVLVYVAQYIVDNLPR